MRAISIQSVMLAIALAGAAVARAAPPERDAAAGPADSGREEGGDLTVVLARGGVLTRVRIEDGHLVARNATGDAVADRVLLPEGRARLLGAARRALADPFPQHGCPDVETFVAVTLERKTSSASVCDRKNRAWGEIKRWQELLALVRALLGAG